MSVVFRQGATEGSFSFGRVVAFKQDKAELGQRVHVIRFERERLAEFGLCQVVISAGAGGDAYKVMGLRRVRETLLGAAKHFKRLIELAQHDVSAAQPGVISELAVILLQSPFVEINCGRCALVLSQSFTKHEVSLRKLRAQRNSAVPIVGSLLVIALAPGNQSQIVVRLRRFH